MILYHGTDEQSAIKITNKIDVTLGGGELGRGFYAGENIALAAAISYGKKGPSNSKVIELNINDREFVKLDIRTLNKRTLVYENWKQYIKLKTIRTFTFGSDVIVGPFATIDFSYQYKFESVKSEIVLNNYTRKKIL